MPTSENDTTQVQIHIDESKIRKGIPSHDPRIRCKKHPKYPPEDGFGLAGGGYGVYTYCQICGDVLSKSEISE